LPALNATFALVKHFVPTVYEQSVYIL
jgi:hypothetical protein